MRRLLTLLIGLLFIGVAHAQITAPTLTVVGRSEGATMTPGTMFMFSSTFTKGTNNVILLDVAYKDPNGVLRHALLPFPTATNYVWVTVQRDWPNGAYSVEYFQLEDVTGTFTTYYRDGTVAVEGGTATAPANHPLNLGMLDFRVSGAGGVITLGAVTAVSRTTSSPVSAGSTVNFNYTCSEGDDRLTYVSITYTGPDGWSYDGGSSIANPLPLTGTMALSLTSTRPNGPYMAEEVTLRDASGRAITYKRDHTVVVSNGAGSAPSPHALDLGTLDFEVTGGVTIDPVIRLTGVARTSATTVSPGNSVRFECAFLAVSGTAIGVDVAFNDESGATRHATASATAGTNLTSPTVVGATIGADWPEGAYAITEISFEDDTHRIVHYARDGRITVSNGFNFGPTHHSVDLVSADFHVTHVPVIDPPVITAQPAAQTAAIGTTVSFTVTASGTAPAYQWSKDGVTITDATDATFAISAVQATDSAAYTCRVSNAGGFAVTNPATLTVTGPRAWLTNLSIRTTMSAGQNPVIIGLTVTGGAKPVLVRGGGPALTAFGLTNILADPRLDGYVFGASTIAWANDDWDSSKAMTDIFDSVGAFGFTAGSKDAALRQNLEGSYTVHTPGTGNGIVLIEAYDTRPNVNSPRLTNISARNTVGSGDNVLIAGFNIGGTGMKRLLIRAVGPRLAEYGVGGTLRDPLLQVYDSDRHLVAENNDWDSSLTADFDAVNAFPLSTGSKDAALVTTLAPGIYSAQVKGADGGTGEAMVEVYELP